MSTELINRITVKKDGVYISSHSSNDTAPFHSWRCKGLSEIYAAEGQKGLDREIVCMLYKKTGQQIMELLLQIVRENNIMLLLVTHDSDIANTCDTIFEMDEGRLRCAKNDF